MTKIRVYSNGNADPELASNADRMLLLTDGKTKASDIRSSWVIDESEGEEE